MPSCLVQEHIQEIFSTYGKIKMIDMPMDRLHPHLSKGYCYVEYETPEEAEKALKHMDGGELQGGYTIEVPQGILGPTTGLT